MLILYLWLELRVQATALNWGWGWRWGRGSDHLISRQKKASHAQSLNSLWCHNNQVPQPLGLPAPYPLPWQSAQVTLLSVRDATPHCMLAVSHFSLVRRPFMHWPTQFQNSIWMDCFLRPLLVTLTKSVGKLAGKHTLAGILKRKEWRGTICRSWGRIQSTYKDDKAPGNLQQ